MMDNDIKKEETEDKGTGRNQLCAKEMRRKEHTNKRRPTNEENMRLLSQINRRLELKERNKRKLGKADRDERDEIGNAAKSQEEKEKKEEADKQEEKERKVI